MLRKSFFSPEEVQAAVSEELDNNGAITDVYLDDNDDDQGHHHHQTTKVQMIELVIDLDPPRPPQRISSPEDFLQLTATSILQAQRRHYEIDATVLSRLLQLVQAKHHGNITSLILNKVHLLGPTEDDFYGPTTLTHLQHLTSLRATTCNMDPNRWITNGLCHLPRLQCLQLQNVEKRGPHLTALGIPNLKSLTKLLQRSTTLHTLEIRNTQGGFLYAAPAGDEEEDPNAYAPEFLSALTVPSTTSSSSSLVICDLTELPAICFETPHHMECLEQMLAHNATLQSFAIRVPSTVILSPLARGLAQNKRLQTLKVATCFPFHTNDHNPLRQRNHRILDLAVPEEIHAFEQLFCGSHNPNNNNNNTHSRLNMTLETLALTDDNFRMAQLQPYDLAGSASCLTRWDAYLYAWKGQLDATTSPVHHNDDHDNDEQIMHNVSGEWFGLGPEDDDTEQQQDQVPAEQVQQQQDEPPTDNDPNTTITCSTSSHDDYDGVLEQRNRVVFCLLLNQLGRRRFFLSSPGSPRGQQLCNDDGATAGTTTIHRQECVDLVVANKDNLSVIFYFLQLNPSLLYCN